MFCCPHMRASFCKIQLLRKHDLSEALHLGRAAAITSRGGSAVPSVRTDIVKGYALSFFEQMSQGFLRKRVSLHRGPAGPPSGLGIVSWYAVALVIHRCQVVLRFNDPLLCRCAKPPGCLLVVWLNACAKEVHRGQVALGDRVASLS